MLCPGLGPRVPCAPSGGSPRAGVRRSVGDTGANAGTNSGRPTATGGGSGGPEDIDRVGWELRAVGDRVPSPAGYSEVLTESRLLREHPLRGVSALNTRRLASFTFRTSPVDDNLTAQRPTSRGVRGGQNLRITPLRPLYLMSSAKLVRPSQKPTQFGSSGCVRHKKTPIEIGNGHYSPRSTNVGQFDPRTNCETILCCR